MLLFISYSHVNQAPVDRLYTYLRAVGAEVWIDQEQLTPGTRDWEDAIRVGIQACDVVIYAASPDALRAPAVRGELEVAKRFGKRIIPLWLEGEYWADCVPLDLAWTQYADARGERFDSSVTQLAATLGLRTSAGESRQSTAESTSENVHALTGEGRSEVRGASPSSARSPGYQTEELSDLAGAREATRSRSISRSGIYVLHQILVITLAVTVVFAAIGGLILVNEPSGSRTGTQGSGTPGTRKTPISSSAPSTSPISQVLVGFGSQSGDLSVLHASNGSPAWHAHMPSWVASRPVVSGGLVYVGSDSGSLYAYRVADGSEVWHYDTGNKVDSWPIVVGGIVFFGSWNGNVYALRGTDGRVLWTYHTGGLIAGAPQADEGVIYIGSADGYLYALGSASGNLIWKYQTGGGIDAQPAVADGTVYIGSQDGYLYALRVRDGSQIWRYQTNAEITNSSPAFANGVIYVGGFDHRVYAVNAADGTLRWSYATEADVHSSPAVSGDVVFVGSSDRYLYALQAQDGHLLWKTGLGGGIGTKPLMYESVLFVGSTCCMSALRPSDGTILWRFPSAESGSPAIID
jgi:outer membrane protein assembly factor BamB